MPASPPCETPKKIEELQKLPVVELKKQWSKLYERPLPPTARRDYLVRAIAYRLQEQDGQGLLVSVARRLDLTPTKPGQRVSVSPIKLREGSKLLREYQGTTHEVEVVAHGYSYGGRFYASLSEIARKITGTRWSGPLFFGLKRSGGDVAAKSPAPKYVVDLTTPDAPRRGRGAQQIQEVTHGL